ncbi:CD209 antigen-like protein C isoform X1 [Macrobrachium rosenbergii]|uniref:CD209 antigen-like protein C isoform X1 n=1 Tax=Macrobrachium rosenbergii TaxID=79674 RepID=UPI0034D76007
MECSSMAGTTSFRVLATILLLAIAGRCYSQQMDHIQLSRIAAAIENLTQVEQVQAVASEKVASGIMKLFTSATTQAVASEKVASGIMKMLTLMATDHLVCERGWFKLRSSCYFISKDTSTWEGSRQKCIALNSDLVKITHDDEYSFLRDLAKGHNTYIGLSDLQEGTFRWVADGTVHQIVESWWGKDQPDDYEGGEDCVHYRSSNDGLNDIACDKKFRYICEKPAHLGWNFASVLDEGTPTEK